MAPEQQRSATVAIVGAGASGLVALKEMVEAGHDAVLFERSSTLGGVFSGAGTPPPFHLTISNWFMAFSDFPPDDPVRYPTCADYLAYLHRYVRHFQLEPRIRYRTEVRSAELLERDGKWRLETVEKGQQPSIRMFDAMVVATGANQQPRKTTFSSGINCESLPLVNLDRFNGRVLHSSEYTEDFRRQVREHQLRVLVIGTGESGADIAGDLAGTVTKSKDSHHSSSQNIVVWSRSAPCVSPRYIDPAFSEAEHLARNHQGVDDDGKHVLHYPVTSFAESFTTCRAGSGINVYFYGLFRLFLMLLGGPDPTTGRWNIMATRGAPVRFDQATWVTKTALMSHAVNAGALEVRIGGPSPPEALGGKTVRLRGSSSAAEPEDTVTEREFDAVILCTGFDSSFPWIRVPRGCSSDEDGQDNGLPPPQTDEEENDSGQTTPFTSSNPRDWYLHCFPPGLGHRLFFVGYARPQQGGIPPLSEILSRYIAQLLRLPSPVSSSSSPSSRRPVAEERNKKESRGGPPQQQEQQQQQNQQKQQETEGAGRKEILPLPLPADYAALARRDAAAERAYYSLRPDLHSLVDYNAFIESVGRRLGCEPRLPLWACVVPFNLHMLATAGTALGFLWWSVVAVYWVWTSRRPDLTTAPSSSSSSLLFPCSPFSFSSFCYWYHLSSYPFLITFISSLLLWTLTTAYFLLAVARGDAGSLLVQFLFYPCWPLWYRLRGPGADPGLVRAALRRLPVSESVDVSSPFFAVFAAQSLCAFYAQRALSVVLFLLLCLPRRAGLGFFSFLFTGMRRRREARGGAGDDEDPVGYEGRLAWLRPKQYVLHGCPWRFEDLFLP